MINQEENDSVLYYLLNKIQLPKIEKGNIVVRDAVNREQRPSATPRFLATGKSYEDFKFNTAISPQLPSKMVPRACTAIHEALKEEYSKVKLN